MNRITLAVVVSSLILASSLACSFISQFVPGAVQEPPANESTSQTQDTATQQDQAQEPETEPVEDATTDNGEQPTGDGLVVPPPGSGACDNTFYPLVPGNQWIYEITSEGETSQIGLTVTGINTNQATLNALYLESGITTEVTVECQDGAIVNFPILLLGFLFGDVDGEMNLDHQGGIYMPSYQTFVANNWNYNWTSEYTASGVVEAVVEGDQVTGRLEESPLDMEWEIIGPGEAIFEGITVKAGDFPQAIKIQREATFDFTAELVEEGQQISLDAVLSLHTNHWYEPNMGLLKQEIDRASVKVYGVNFPITMEGSVELVEFRTGE